MPGSYAQAGNQAAVTLAGPRASVSSCSSSLSCTPAPPTLISRFLETTRMSSMDGRKGEVTTDPPMTSSSAFIPPWRLHIAQSTPDTSAVKTILPTLFRMEYIPLCIFSYHPSPSQMPSSPSLPISTTLLPPATTSRCHSSVLPYQPLIISTIVAGLSFLDLSLSLTNHHPLNHRSTTRPSTTLHSTL